MLTTDAEKQAFRTYVNNVTEHTMSRFGVSYLDLATDAPSMDRGGNQVYRAFKGDITAYDFARLFGDAFGMKELPAIGLRPTQEEQDRFQATRIFNKNIAQLYEFGSQPECEWNVGVDGAAYNFQSGLAIRIKSVMTNNDAVFEVAVAEAPEATFDVVSKNGLQKISVAPSLAFSKVAWGHDIDIALGRAQEYFDKNSATRDISNTI